MRIEHQAALVVKSIETLANGLENIGFYGTKDWFYTHIASDITNVGDVWDMTITLTKRKGVNHAVRPIHRSGRTGRSR